MMKVGSSSANKKLIKWSFGFLLSLLLAIIIFWETFGGRLTLLMRPNYAITAVGGCVVMSEGWYLTENIQSSDGRGSTMVGFIKLKGKLSAEHKNYAQFTFSAESLPEAILHQADKYLYPWGDAYTITDETIKKHIGVDLQLIKNTLYLEQGKISATFLDNSEFNDIRYVSAGATSRCAALGRDTP